MNYIPWIISFLSLVVCVLTYIRNGQKDEKEDLKENNSTINQIKESLLKANIKLDTVCSTTTETRADIKSLNTELKNMDTRVVVLERDMKTAFNAIAELKRKISHED